MLEKDPHYQFIVYIIYLRHVIPQILSFVTVFVATSTVAEFGSYYATINDNYSIITIDPKKLFIFYELLKTGFGRVKARER